METAETQTAAIDSIRDERAAQDRKWGAQDHPDIYWLAILTEEVGELAERVLHFDDAGIWKESTQVGAVAVAWLESILRRREKAALLGKEGPHATGD